MTCMDFKQSRATIPCANSSQPCRVTCQDSPILRAQIFPLRNTLMSNLRQINKSENTPVAVPSVASSGRTEAVCRACRWRRFGCTGLGWCCIGATHSKHGSFGYLKYKRSAKEVQRKGNKISTKKQKTQNTKQTKSTRFRTIHRGQDAMVFNF